MTKGHFYVNIRDLSLLANQNVPGIGLGVYIKIKRKVSSSHKY